MVHSPVLIAPDWDGIPDDLKTRDRWVLWRAEDGKKVPYSARTRRLASIKKATAGAASFCQTASWPRT